MKRGTTHEAFAEASTGLQIEELPASVEALCAQEAAFGRLFITLDFQSVTMLESGGFEVSVDVAGMCPTHPHPVLYAATSESESFMVIIPFAGLGTAIPPSSEACFVACTEILRATKPMETPPFKTMRLDNFDVRHATRTIEVSDCSAYGLPKSSGPLHIAEFDSVSVSAGS